MKKNILLINDDKAFKQSFNKKFSVSSYKIFQSKNLKSAYNVIKKKNLDLIILDMEIKNGDSIEFFNFLKNDYRFSKISIILLTSNPDSIDALIDENFLPEEIVNKSTNMEMIKTIVKTLFLKAKVSKRKFDTKIDSMIKDLSISLPHEFITPLNAIIGLSKMILDECAKKNTSKHSLDEISEMAGLILNSGKRLNKLTENILLYSQLRSIADNEEKITDFKRKVIYNTKEIIMECINNLGTQYNRLQDIDYDLDEAELKISGYFFYKIIYELLDNALKFSPIGSKIQINTKYFGEMLQLNIIDHGRGLKHENLSEVGAFVQFERYFHEQQGAGLGLAIVKLISDLHEGNFKLNQVNQSGTYLTLSLPYKKS